MCGFIGFNGYNFKCNESIAKKMIKRIKHRGPDGEDYYIGENLVLGFTRLSLVDLNGGMQPMYNEDDTLVLVFNGEIYNHNEIRRELIAKGHKFRSSSDSEVILHGYEEYGSDVLKLLRGMFSFVIYNIRENVIFGARDQFGIKPFYYYKRNKVFMFASEIKAFLEHPKYEKEFNEELLPMYLTFGCISGNETFFNNTFKLEPGSYFIYKNNEMKIKKYFQMNFEIDDKLNINDITDSIKNILKESVHLHINADVPVGSFLSSGVDSSYTTYLMNNIAKVKSYTIDFEEKKFSEAHYAAEFAKQIGCENESVIISSKEYFKDAKMVQYYMDEPLANPSANLLYYLCKRATKDYKSIISGEGADELFGGYNIYKEVLSLKYYKMLPKEMREYFAKKVKTFPNFKGKNFIIRGSKKVEERYIGNSYIFNIEEINTVLKNNYKIFNPFRYVNRLYKEVEGLDDISKMQYIDINLWLRQEILLKADKMAMANSLELRVPFLDTKVYNIAKRIPSKYKVSRKNTKIALRYSATKEFGEYVSNRKKLMFPSPIVKWIKEDGNMAIIQKYFNSDMALKYFEKEELENLIVQLNDNKKLIATKVWAIFTFLLWYECYFIEN